MAESTVAFTPGSGDLFHANSRTIGVNTVKQQVVLAAEPYLATYSVTTASTSIATANAHVLQIMAGASLPVYLKRLIVYQSVAVNTGAITTAELWALTTAGTGGTSVTPAPIAGDSASGATAMTLPTAKGTEGTKFWSGTTHAIQTIGAGGSGIDTVLFDLEWDGQRRKSPRIAAGTSNGLALKWVTASTGGSVIVYAELIEASF